MPTTSKTILLDAPNVGSLEKQYLDRCIDSGFVSTIGPFVGQFEQNMAAWLQAQTTVATQSGTAALHASLLEAGIGEGDEVILPVLTFVASANPVKYVRARPVFVDVDPHTWNIDPVACEKAITERTRAIVPVHLLGNPCDMRPILDIARRHRLLVVEDATESLGGRYEGRHMGTLGDFGCLSFNGNKMITTGGGGMVLGTDPERLRHVKFLVNQARDESRGYYHPEIGMNYRMTNLEAALGLAQLERLDGFLEQKREFHRIYEQELSSISGLRLQHEHEGARSAWWLTGVRFDRTLDLPALQQALLERRIQTRRMFVPIVEFPPYAGCRSGTYPHAQAIYDSAICLPGSTLNTPDDIVHVCRALRELL